MRRFLGAFAVTADPVRPIQSSRPRAARKPSAAPAADCSTSRRTPGSRRSIPPAGTRAGGSSSPWGKGEQSGFNEHLDLTYGNHERHKLDLYQPTDAKNAPIMVYIHGGGWRRGDKRGVGEKVGFFVGRGWVFVSINYRLLP